MNVVLWRRFGMNRVKTKLLIIGVCAKEKDSLQIKQQPSVEKFLITFSSSELFQKVLSRAEDIYSNSVHECLNPSNAVATFVQSTRKQRVLKPIQTLSC